MKSHKWFGSVDWDDVPQRKLKVFKKTKTSLLSFSYVNSDFRMNENEKTEREFTLTSGTLLPLTESVSLGRNK